jgi:hypothetical protein
MARRATSALAATLACAALALPTVILVGQRSAAAATTDHQAAQSPFSVAITGMTPQWATSRSKITVTGTLRNNSKTAVSHPIVQLLGSSTPVNSVAELQQDASQQYSPATTPLANVTWQARGLLRPGDTANWSIHLAASAIGLTTFGVYPVAAQAEDQYGNTLLGGLTTTYLPYEPDRKGPYASSQPTPAKIAWLWPLIDTPQLNEPWQGNCSGAQAGALAQGLGPGGRLAELARVGATDQDVTWVIDPAVLANVRALTTCQNTQPRWAQAASVWLADLQSDTSGRPLTVTPYGDPNAAALFDVGHGADVNRSYDLGRALGSAILGHRLLDPGASGGTSGTVAPLTQAAGIAWSATGVPGYPTLEQLANVDSVCTLVLSSAAFPGGQYSVLKTLDGGGSGSSCGTYMTALLASQSLTQLLATTASGPGGAFSTSQQFLAETALLAEAIPAQPIVVAPPPRWAPSTALATDLIADTSSAPWLSQVSLTTLASAKHIPIVLNNHWPAGSLGSTRITRPELRKVRTLNREVLQLEDIRARPDPGLYLAVSTLESSSVQAAPPSTADAMLAAVAKRIAQEQQAVRIIAEKRITLGGLKGSVPVSIDNHLSYPIRVQFQLQYSQASGIKIAPDPQGLITVPPHQTQTIRLRVEATGVGSTIVTMLLATKRGYPVSVPLRMTIQATQVGTLGMIIFAAALGIFLIASAARAVRRGRPGAGVTVPAGDGRAHDRGVTGSAEPAEADTVKAERAELRPVGKPGP